MELLRDPIIPKVLSCLAHSNGYLMVTLWGPQTPSRQKHLVTCSGWNDSPSSYFLKFIYLLGCVHKLSYTKLMQITVYSGRKCCCKGLVRKFITNVVVAGFPLAFAMSPLANQTKNWRNGICIFSPIWRNQINDNSNPMAKHSHCFH